MQNNFAFAIYFTDSKNYNPNLRSFFQNNGVELYYEDELSKLLCRILASHPQMIIIDNIPETFISRFVEIFAVHSPFYVPFVYLFSEKNQSDFNKSLPYNCSVCNKFKYELVLKDKLDELKVSGNNQNISKCFPVDRFDNIIKALRDVGVNVKSCGSIFLKDCINQVLLDGCRAYTLYNTVYSIVAKQHGTTINNLERCMRTSINAAWNNRKNVLSTKNESYIFGEKPTVKEFIYYISNLVKDMEYSQRILGVANGTLKRNVS